MSGPIDPPTATDYLRDRVERKLSVAEAERDLYKEKYQQALNILSQFGKEGEQWAHDIDNDA